MGAGRQGWTWNQTDLRPRSWNTGASPPALAPSMPAGADGGEDVAWLLGTTEQAESQTS